MSVAFVIRICLVTLLSISMQASPSWAENTCPTKGVSGKFFPTPQAGVNLQGCDLSYGDLKGLDLSNANLAGADLSGSKLSGSRITGANIQGTRFPECGFDRQLGVISGNLTGYPASVYGSFIYANPRNYNGFLVYCNATLDGANLSGISDLYVLQASAIGTDFSGCTVSRQVSGNFTNAKFDRCVFSGSSRNTPFSGEFSGATFKGASFYNMDIRDGRFKFADFTGVFPKGNNWFPNATISCPSCGFSGTFPTNWFDAGGGIFLGPGVVQTGQSLIGLNAEGKNLSNSDFSNADLSYANFNSSNLAGANLIGATLTGATWVGTKWTADPYILTYNYNLATSGNSAADATFTTGGTAITLPTPTRTGYTFAGWYSDEALTSKIGDGGASYSPSGSTLTLYAHAKWTRNPIKTVSTVKPTVTGTVKVSKTLTAKKGTWTGYPTPSISYQWYACSGSISAAISTVPTKCKVIAGANKSTFRIAPAQKGKFISVSVTGSSAGTTKTTWLTKSTSKVS